MTPQCFIRAISLAKLSKRVSNSKLDNIYLNLLKEKSFIGGKLIGFFPRKGKLIVAINKINKCKPDEMIIFFVTKVISIYKVQKLEQLLKTMPDKIN